MKNKSVHSCRFVHHAKFHCIMPMLNKLFKFEFERGDWKRAGSCIGEVMNLFNCKIWMKLASIIDEFCIAENTN